MTFSAKFTNVMVFIQRRCHCQKGRLAKMMYENYDVEDKEVVGSIPNRVMSTAYLMISYKIYQDCQSIGAKTFDPSRVPLRVPSVQEQIPQSLNCV